MDHFSPQWLSQNKKNKKKTLFSLKANQSHPKVREFFQTKILEYKPFIVPSDLYLQEGNEKVVNKRNNDGFNSVNIHINCENSR